MMIRQYRINNLLKKSTIGQENYYESESVAVCLNL